MTGYNAFETDAPKSATPFNADVRHPRRPMDACLSLYDQPPCTSRCVCSSRKTRSCRGDSCGARRRRSWPTLCCPMPTQVVVDKAAKDDAKLNTGDFFQPAMERRREEDRQVIMVAPDLSEDGIERIITLTFFFTAAFHRRLEKSPVFSFASSFARFVHNHLGLAWRNTRSAGTSSRAPRRVAPHERVFLEEQTHVKYMVG